MLSIFKNRLLLFFFTPLFCTACISNKKHQVAIDLINTTHNGEVTFLQEKIDTANNKIRGLELKLAERIGENNVLLMLRDELSTEVSKLENNIESLSNSSSSTQKNLVSDLNKKDQEIKVLKDLIVEVETTIVAHQDAIKKITDNLNLIAKDHPEEIEVTLGFDYAIIDIKESFLFKRNSTTRLEDSGYTILERFSSIFQESPNLKVEVIGHTDTTPPRDKKRYNDNWNFSALQAATVVRTLVDEYDVSANQLTLGAKGEFAPKASNATKEGKSQNRRIELNITISSEALAKKIRAGLADTK